MTNPTLPDAALCRDRLCPGVGPHARPRPVVEERRRTAATPHIHANTVDYRLRRIAEAAGLDPAKRLDLRHLEALIARELESTRCGLRLGSGR